MNEQTPKSVIGEGEGSGAITPDPDMTLYELDTLRVLNGEDVPGWVGGAEANVCCAWLKSRGYAEGHYQISQKGVAYLAALDATPTDTPHPTSETELREAADLSNRLRGRYAVGPRLPSGEPEFGYREFKAMPNGAPFPAIHGEAADMIDALLERIKTLEGERDEAESHRALYAKTLYRLNDTLQNVLDGVEDEVDRTYFGSTNDVDALTAIAQKIDALHGDKVLEHTQPKVNLYEAIENRIIEREAALNRASSAEAALDEALGALEPFAKIGAVLESKPKDDACWAGQTPAPPITFGHLRQASEVHTRLSKRNS